MLGGFINSWLISGITNIQSGPEHADGRQLFAWLLSAGQSSARARRAYPVESQSILGTPDVNLQPVLNAIRARASDRISTSTPTASRCRRLEPMAIH